MAELVETGDFEDVLNWAIGTHGHPAFKVSQDAAGLRIVIDIAALRTRRAGHSISGQDGRPRLSKPHVTSAGGRGPLRGAAGPLGSRRAASESARSSVR